MRAGFIILIFLTHTSFGQFTYRLDQSIPVTLANGNALAMPWAGGLNATHFNTIHLNQDNLEDLAIFDRTANRVITFIRENTQYRYAPEYGVLFPNDITNWMLLRDYNGDGKKDIFTDYNNDIKVYMNITPAGEPLQWQHFLFFTGVGAKSPILLSKGTSFKINVHLNSNDLPSIGDADGDGDVDLFVPKYPSSSTIEFHKNFSVERYGVPDSLDFERITQKWAGITECDCGEFAFNNNPCSVGGRRNHAGGKSLFAFDADNDGDHDLLFSEEGETSEGGCSQLFLLKNEGDNNVPVVTESIPYPPSSPVSIVTYPAAFYEDVDFDGIKDLLASPNIRTSQFLITNFQRSVWFYKNTGTSEQPVFNTPITNFLQNDMIDVGENAVPALFDADGDADLDLFLGNYSLNFRGSIHYFENTGTPSAPIFNLVTSDYLGLSFLNLINIKPMFIDMNSDSKIDLAFTATSLSGSGTQLYYLPNQHGIGANFSPQLVATGFIISSNDNLSVIDVNFDGKKDLLIGRRNGSLEYWKNTSNTATPEYDLENESYLGFESSVTRNSPSCNAADLDGDGRTDLLVGDNTGSLTIISNFREATDASDSITNMLYNPITETYQSQNLGGSIWCAVGNIFKTDRPAIIVGNALGGIHIVKHDEGTLVPETPIIDIYPNPIAKANDLLTIRVDRPAALIAYTTLGQQMGAPAYLQAFEDFHFQLNTFPKGVYLLNFVFEGKSQTRRIVVF